MKLDFNKLELGVEENHRNKDEVSSWKECYNGKRNIEMKQRNRKQKDCERYREKVEDSERAKET